MTCPVPVPDDIINVSRVLEIIRETLEYCAAQACLANGEGNLSYDDQAQEITYHLNVQDWDAQLFDTLYGVEEIWIVTGVSRDS